MSKCSSSKEATSPEDKQQKLRSSFTNRGALTSPGRLLSSRMASGFGRRSRNELRLGNQGLGRGPSEIADHVQLTTLGVSGSHFREVWWPWTSEGESIKETMGLSGEPKWVTTNVKVVKLWFNRSKTAGDRRNDEQRKKGKKREPRRKGSRYPGSEVTARVRPCATTLSALW